MWISKAVNNCFFDIMGFKESDDIVTTQTFYDKHYGDIYTHFDGHDGDYIIYMGVQLDNNMGHKSEVVINIDGAVYVIDKVDTRKLVSELNKTENKYIISKFGNKARLKI